MSCEKKLCIYAWLLIFFFAILTGLLIERISDSKGGIVMNMFDFYKIILREAARVWKPKYAFWWVCLVVYMFVDTYNSIWLYWIGEPVTVERFNQAFGMNITAGLIGLIGVIRLFKAWKEER